MYVILVYDFNEKRVNKALKICRKYLHWIQNSVFEGEITKARLERLKFELKRIMNEEEDSVIIFSSEDNRWMDKEIIGLEKGNISNIL